MNKKIILSLVASLIAGQVFAGSYREVPRGPDSALPTAEYGGYNKSTGSLTSNSVLAFTGEGVVGGFIASSNTAITDYIVFMDTPTASSNDTGTEFARVYLSTTVATSGNIAQSALGTTYKFPYPIRVSKGLAWKASVGTINMITVLYEKYSK